MPIHTAHPSRPVPRAPVRERTRHLVLRAWCTFVLFLALSGVSWVNAIGTVATGVLTVVTALVSAVVWMLVRPPVHGQRLPWLPLVYVALAAASVVWSAWRGVSALTWLLLAITTLQGLFVAVMLTWHEIVRAFAAALKWCLGLSLLFELIVALFVRGPLLPEFALPAPGSHHDPIVFWSRGNLFDAGRIQGVFGNANLLAAVCLLAVIVFGVAIALRVPHRPLLWVWEAVAVFLLVRAGSATVYVAAVVVAAVLVAALLMRAARSHARRRVLYAVYVVVGVVGVAVALFARGVVFGMLGRGADLTHRAGIWADVLERTAQRPWAGWGFATPWPSWDPHFDGWIIDHGQSVMQAHNMWVDVSMQLGFLGVGVLALLYFTFVWRTWFFAVDRPRWDLQADRPYSPVTLLPVLVATQLLVLGMTESEPLLLWGWLSVVLLSMKIKQAPHVGVGADEARP